MKRYLLGNITKGWYEGEFESHDLAWKYLGNRFMLDIPVSGLACSIIIYNVEMFVFENNKYGYPQYIRCKFGKILYPKNPDIEKIMGCTQKGITSLFDI